MAGVKLNARQKMINLMYLVFIAMMALNIDREVLRAFDNIDKSLTKSNSNATGNNDKFMETIKARAKADPEYAKTLKDANYVRDLSKELVSYIGTLKSRLIGPDSSVDENGEPNYNTLSNLESVTNLFFVDDKTVKPDATELVSKINKFNQFLSSIKKDAFKINIEDVDLKGQGKQSWLHRTFYGQPQVAATTTLTKIQNDVISAEGEIIRSYLTTKMLESIEVNTFKGIISSPGIIVKGTAQNTFVALGAFDNRISGTATVNGRSYPVIDGKATIPVDASSTGKKQLAGTMSFKDGKGVQQNIPLETVNYEVVDVTITNPDFTGVITADKMNVLYVGVSNPVSATVSGVQPSSIRLSGPGLSSTGAGKGNVTPGSVGVVNLTVSGTTSSGKAVSKSVPFRVKALPKPEAVVRARSILAMPNTSLSGQLVEAKMPDDFGFDVRVSVTGFSVKVPGRPAQTVSGNRLGAASSVASAKPGSTVTIFDIKSSTNGIPLRPASNNVVIEVQ